MSTPDELPEPVAWLWTGHNGHVQAFVTKPPPSMLRDPQCQPLYAAPPPAPPEALAALSELVALKELKERLQQEHEAEYIAEGRGEPGINMRQHQRDAEEYRRRKPLAWAAAIKVVNQKPDSGHSVGAVSGDAAAQQTAPVLKRSIKTYRDCDPSAMAHKQSPTAIQFAFEDMRADILTLHAFATKQP